MSVLWPIGLPSAPLVRGLLETVPDLVVRSAVDVGPAKVRRRLTAGVRTFNVRFSMTFDQMELFDEFFLTSIRGGALPFLFTNPRTGEQVDMRIVGRPQYPVRTPRLGTGRHGEVIATFEVLPRAADEAPFGGVGALAATIPVSVTVPTPIVVRSLVVSAPTALIGVSLPTPTARRTLIISATTIGIGSVGVGPVANQTSDGKILAETASIGAQANSGFIIAPSAGN